MHTIIQKSRTFFANQAVHVDHPDEYPVVFFVSFSDGQKQAIVWQTRAATFAQSWNKVERYLKKKLVQPKWLKIDMVTKVEKQSNRTFHHTLKETPRANYFRQGIAFDPDFYYALLEEEINSNALLVPSANHVPGKNKPYLSFQQDHLTNYMLKKYQKPVYLDIDHQAYFWTFETVSLFFDHERDVELNQLQPNSRPTDTKEALTAAIQQAVQSGASYLGHQLEPSGKFIYGYYPALRRKLTSYNTVRHFSTLYAWLEAAAYLNQPTDYARIESGLVYGLTHFERQDSQLDALFMCDYLPKNEIEIKLGSNALALLALLKFTEVTGEQTYKPQMQALVQGICSLISPIGDTVHVLTEDFRTKEEFRTVYYDGEALFALARYAKMYQDRTVLAIAERLAQRLITKDYQKYHDHWLSYAINELLQVAPKPIYARFGLANATENLTFIQQRDTAYPTMLELLNAAIDMCATIEKNSSLRPLLAEYPAAQDLFKIATSRARYQLALGTFFPEVALYFPNPQRILGGFFARHDHFRTRIDDCEHFLSGLIHFEEHLRKEAKPFVAHD